MGWKQFARSMNAAQRKAQQEKERQERQTQRAVQKIGRNTEELLKKVHRYQEQICKDPIKSFGLSYNVKHGFSSKPFEIKTDIFTTSINLNTTPIEADDDTKFTPSAQKNASILIGPLRLMLSPWGTFIPILIDNYEQTSLPLASWFDPSKPKVFLFDKQNAKYYMPTSTDLVGEVLAGTKRIGIIAFPRLELPGKVFELHFSEVVCSKTKPSPTNFRFVYSDPEMPNLIQQVKDMPSLVDQMRKHIDDTLAAMAPQKRAGCGTTVLLLLLLIWAVSLLV